MGDRGFSQRDTSGTEPVGSRGVVNGVAASMVDHQEGLVCLSADRADPG